MTVTLKSRRQARKYASQKEIVVLQRHSPLAPNGRGGASRPWGI